MKRFLLSIVLLMPFLFAGSLYGAAAGNTGGDRGRGDVNVIHRGDLGGGWLGVSIAERGDTAGARVAGVAKGSPAEKAGVKVGDVILQVNGKEIEDRWDLLKEVREADPGTKTALLVKRGGKHLTITATLDRAPEEFGGVIPPGPRIRPRIPHPPMVMHFSGFGDSYGLSLVDLSDQLAEYFGAPGKHGVLVDEVEKGTPADTAGFRAGDVIILVGKDTVEDANGVWTALDRYKEGERADVQVLRRGTAQTLALAIPGEKNRATWNGFFGPHRFRYNFHWDSERFERQMKQLEERLGRMGKDLKQRMKGVEKRIREKLEKIEV